MNNHDGMRSFQFRITVALTSHLLPYPDTFLIGGMWMFHEPEHILILGVVPVNRLDIQRKMVYSGIGRTRKLRTHRRQLSDPKLHLDMVGPLKDGSDPQYSRVSTRASLIYYVYVLTYFKGSVYVINLYVAVMYK